MAKQLKEVSQFISPDCFLRSTEVCIKELNVKPTNFHDCSYPSQLAMLLYANWTEGTILCYKELGFISRKDGSYLIVRGRGRIIHDSLDIRELIEDESFESWLHFAGVAPTEDVISGVGYAYAS